MSEAAFVKSPEPLKMGGNMSHTWDRWKRRFNIFLQASGLSTKGTKQKVGILLHIIGDEGLEIYENLDFLPRRTIDDQEIPAEDKDNFDCVIKKYDEYFTKRDPQLMLREKFWIHLKREPGQSFDAWTNLVKEKATECKFPDVYREQAVRDKLTFCCLDDSTKLRLYDQGADLTLPKAITIISLHEATSQELRESKTASIDVVQKKSAHNKRRSINYGNKNHSDNRTCKQPTSNCGYCGKNHNRGIKNCPAAKATCHKCHKKGHYAHLCRSTYTASVHHVVQSTNNTQEVDEHSFVGVVSNQERNSGWYLKTRVNGKQLIWVVDTGAQRSIMPEALYKPSYGKLEQSDVTLIGAGDKTLDILGCVKMEISNENRRISETVYVIKGGSKLLLGIPGIRALGLLDDIPGTYSIRAVCHAKEVEPFTRNTSDCVKHKYPKLFSGLGKLSGQYNICLREEAKPFCITAPRRIPLPLLKKTEEEIQRMVNLPASDKRLEEIRRELQNDEIMKQLKYYIVHGWPSKVTGPVKKYWPERASLTIHEGLILRGNQMLIPTSLRRDILRYLHDGHQGITKTRQNAANSVWWPHINTDIERIVRNCNICEKYRRERIEPMKGTEFPERPWSRVGADFFYHKGRNYIIAIDYYSRDVEICLVSNTCDTAETVVKVKKVFSRHGICDVLFTDNGPQFASAEFKAFANDWGFEHITSSPRYPQANGEAERAVQNIKSILNKCKDEYAALLNYRNTPLQNGFSPAQLSMGRRLKTRVPCNPEDLKPQTPDQTILRRKEKAYRDRMRYDYDRRHRVRDHSPVICGDKVWIPDLQTSGTVLRRSVHPRSLIIKTPRTVIRRNQRMVRKPTGDLSSTNPVLDFNIQKPISQTPVNISNDSAITDESEISTCNPSQHRDTPAIRPRRSNRTVKPPNRYIEEC